MKNKNTTSSDIEKILIEILDVSVSAKIENNIVPSLRKYLVTNLSTKIAESMEDDLEISLENELEIYE